MGSVEGVDMSAGPLSGITVLELGGMGPGPAATMLMADLGADVVRVDRADGSSPFPGSPRDDLLNRNKRSIALDLKSPAAIAVVRELVRDCDVLVEGFRPGVAERLGLGPQELCALNSRLVYCRVTGWGQTGPLSASAGHDVNYIAITGALHAIGSAGGPPQIPANMLGDFAAGSAYLVIGALAAVLEARRSGRGQIVDAAIVDGAAHLLTCIHGLLAAGSWQDQRGVNLIDGGAPFYSIYETADGRHMAVGAIEPQFYAELVGRLGIEVELDRQHDRSSWPATRVAIAAAIRRRTQQEWTKVFGDSDGCVSPVLSLAEAPLHPQLLERGTFINVDGVVQPGPAPRLSRTPGRLRTPPPLPGEHSVEILNELGIDPAPLLAAGSVAVSSRHQYQSLQAGQVDERSS